MAKSRPQPKKKPKTPDSPQAKVRAGAVERRELFCQAYVANGRNGTQAAKAAGFSEATAFAKAYTLLQEPSVKARVEELTQGQLTKHKMTAESVMEQLSAIVHFDIRKLLNEDGSPKKLQELDDATALALASVEFDQIGGDDGIVTTRKYKVFDKNPALDKAMRHFGLLPKDGALQVKADNVYICAELVACG